jgi:hypothetical protein
MELARQMNRHHDDVGEAVKEHPQDCESLAILRGAKVVRRKRSENPNRFVDDRRWASRMMKSPPRPRLRLWRISSGAMSHSSRITTSTFLDRTNSATSC